MGCLGRAIEDSLETLSGILNKSVFWRVFSSEAISQRQKKVLNIYLDGKEAKITAQNWARYGAVSLDTAIRDITDLVDKGILSPLPGRVRKVEYSINYVKTDNFLKRFSDICLEQDGRWCYITATFDNMPVRERISDLDYRQHEMGKISDADLIHKYMAYLSTDWMNP